MRKQKLKTLLCDLHTKKLKCKGKEIVLKADRNLFGHMIVVAQSREIDMKQVLSHPLGPIPWALANGDGSLRKTDKATVMNDTTQNVPVAETIPDQSACIVDAMSIIQKLDGNGKTFQVLAKSALKMVIREGGDNSERVDIVFDVYRESSTKDTERVDRGAGSGVSFNNISAGHRLKQWRSFLSEAHNKTMLIEFIADEWTSNDSKAMIGIKTLYVTCGEKCWKITRCETSLVDELQSSQEEADTRIPLHVKHESDHGYKSVVVVSEDTDVMYFALHLQRTSRVAFIRKEELKRGRGTWTSNKGELYYVTGCHKHYLDFTPSRVVIP